MRKYVTFICYWRIRMNRCYVHISTCIFYALRAIVQLWCIIVHYLYIIFLAIHHITFTTSYKSLKWQRLYRVYRFVQRIDKVYRPR